MDPHRILEQLKACLPGVLEDRPVLLAYAHGSLVAGCPTPTSDVDVALVLQPGPDLTPYGRMQLELDIEAEIDDRCDLPLAADVRTINGAPLRVQGKVLTHGVLLYSADEDARVQYEVATRKRYFDFQPVLQMMRNAYFARLKAGEEDA